MRDGQERDEQRERAARNQSRFRAVNERVVEISTPAAFTTFVCECLRINCIEQIPLTVEEYESVRAHPSRFIVTSGHVDLDVERIVDSNDRYWTVEKLGVGKQVAEELDPRGTTEETAGA